jgi:hypothetical protein
LSNGLLFFFIFLRYLHQLPGLVHFIYVDRMNNRVLAPTIGPLHGQAYTSDIQTSQHMVKLITEKVRILHFLSNALP